MIGTDRLTLRRWQASDRASFHAMCNDPCVMEFLGDHQSREQIDAMMDRQNGFQDRLGHCFWAVERKADAAFLGFCGIKPGADGTPIEGLPEIGWRLAVDHWGKGYAREAAQASITWGLTHLDGTIWAMTVPGNVRSWGLMERLGMRRYEDMDFEHPALPPGHELRRHIVYGTGKMYQPLP
jgi:RimJ/RimL family protein N-acetyltransferase